MSKQKSHSPSIASKHWNASYAGPGPWGEHWNGSVQSRIAGKDISARASAAGTRKTLSDNGWRADQGASNEVSRGTRPKHKAGSWKSWGI